MRIKRRTFNNLALAGAASGFAGSARAQGKPITVGFGMALTGGLAPNGKAALLAMQIATEDINAKGGVLGRPLKLVYYDDQSNPSTVPGLYTKLMEVDKVDMLVSGYATNMVAPAMPVVMQKDRTFFGLLGLAVNTEFKYPRYFAIQPAGGPKPKEAFADGFFDVAMAQNPSRKRWPSSAPMPSSHAMRWTAFGRSPRGTTSRSSTTRPTRRPRLTTRRWCARWRRPIPTSSSPRPIRPIRWASFAPATRPASSPSSRAAAWSVCRRPPSRRSSGRC